MTTLGRFSLVLLFFLLLPSFALAQAPDSAATAPSPAAGDSAMRPNWVYYLEGEHLVRLDATPVENAESYGAGGVAKNVLWGGGRKVSMTLPGPTSEVQIREAQPRFRIATQRVLALTVRLGAFEVKKDKRASEVKRDGSRDFFKKGIPLQVTKVADDLYELRPEQPLKAGEYGLAISPYGSVTDFTVTADAH